MKYERYPKNWEDLRKYVLRMSNYYCQFCGLDNGQIVKKRGKEVKIILQIAHLDHDETNHDVKPNRLLALCQRCHLKYDWAEKQARIFTRNSPNRYNIKDLLREKIELKKQRDDLQKECNYLRRVNKTLRQQQNGGVE